MLDFGRLMIVETDFYQIPEASIPLLAYSRTPEQHRQNYHVHQALVHSWKRESSKSIASGGIMLPGMVPFLV